MPWTMEDYPQSLKNLDKLERKKAIDIANAMLKDGYKESDVIPIATQQAEKWYKQASEDELEELKNKHITQHPQDKSAQPEINEKPVYVYFEYGEWKVKTEDAKQASETFKYKKDAIKRAQHIADNKDTKVVEHQKDE